MSHHPPDRHKRERRAQAILARTRMLLEQQHIEPARVLAADPALAERARQVPVQLHDGYSQDVAMSLNGKVGVLIFGSATKPGGGWLNGAKAQEEELSLSSTWGEQARLGGHGFYSEGRGLGGLGPDKVLSAQGLWLIDPQGRPLDPPRSVHLISVAAPNLRNDEVLRLPRNTRIDHLARRLAAALAAWKTEGCDAVVLGAIGCGVFQWPSQESAQALRLALGHQPLGHMAIHLALPDPDMRAAFSQVLNSDSYKARPSVR